MFEDSSGKHSFELTSPEKNEREHIGCIKAMIQGIESGLFDVVAHPDRCFKRRKEWTNDMTALSRCLIDAAVSAGMKLEKNLESMKRKKNYREEFWDLVPDTADVIVGTDAHSIDELVEKWDIQQLYYCEERNT